MRIQISHKEFRKLVGKRIKLLRKSRGWSQEVLAETSGLSYKFIGEIERGSVNPSLDTLLSISNALNVEIVRLFSNEELLVLSGKEMVSIRASLDSLQEILALE
jgi:transcriptional regulator with XRE-family HTH domain